MWITLNKIATTIQNSVSSKDWCMKSERNLSSSIVKQWIECKKFVRQSKVINFESTCFIQIFIGQQQFKIVTNLANSLHLTETVSILKTLNLHLQKMCNTYRKAPLVECLIWNFWLKSINPEVTNPWELEANVFQNAARIILLLFNDLKCVQCKWKQN